MVWGFRRLNFFVVVRLAFPGYPGALMSMHPLRCGGSGGSNRVHVYGLFY